MAKLIAARGRLCAGRVWAGKSGACRASGGLGRCSCARQIAARLWGLLAALLRPAGAAPACRSRSPVAPGSPALWGHASRSEGCRYGRIRGLPGRGDGKIDREPVILGMHRRQLGQSRPMARGAAIAATPTYRITTALAPSSSAPRRRASRRGNTTSRAGRGGCSSRRRRVRAVSRHRAPRRRIPWLGG